MRDSPYYLTEAGWVGVDEQKHSYQPTRLILRAKAATQGRVVFDKILYNVHGIRVNSFAFNGIGAGDVGNTEGFFIFLASATLGSYAPAHNFLISNNTTVTNNASDIIAANQAAPFATSNMFFPHARYIPFTSSVKNTGIDIKEFDWRIETWNGAPVTPLAGTSVEFEIDFFLQPIDTI